MTTDVGRATANTPQRRAAQPSRSNWRSIHWAGGVERRAVELAGDGAGAQQQAPPRRCAGPRKREVPRAEPTGDGGDSPAWSSKRGAYAGGGQPARLDGAVRRTARALGVQLPRRRQPAGGAGGGGRPARSRGHRTDRPRRVLRGGPVRRGGEGTGRADRVRRRTVVGHERPHRGARPARPPSAGARARARRATGGCRGEIAAAHLAGGEKGKPRYDYDRSPRRPGGTGRSSPDAGRGMCVRRCRRVARTPPARRCATWSTGSGPTGSASNSPTTASRATTSATPRSLELAQRYGLGVVATTAAHFAAPPRRAAGHGDGRRPGAQARSTTAAGWLAPPADAHLRSGEEMARLFARYPEAVRGAADLG